MGWETRKGRRYYYGKIREGKKVRSIYFGKGEEGEMVSEFAIDHAMMLDLERHQRAKKDEAFNLVALSYAETIHAVECALSVIGVYRRKGEWRRRQK